MNRSILSKNFTEIATAIFIIAVVSLYVLANFIVGFNLPLYLFAIAFGFALSVVFPRSGVYAIVFLTFIFDRFFTLVPVYWNRTEYKIYPIDILLAGILIGIIFQIFSRKLKVRLGKIDYLVATFFILSFLYFILSATLWQGDFALSVSAFKNYAFYGLFYFLVRFLFSDKEKLSKLLEFILGSAVVVTVFIFIGAIRGEGLWTEFTPLSTPGTRILAFPHGFFLSMALLIALSRIAFKKDEFSKFLEVIIPLWAIGIIGTLMRHLWISIFFSLVFFLVALPREQRKKIKNIFFHYSLLAVILIVVLGYVAVLFPDLGISKTFLGAAGVAGKRFVSTAQVSADESLNWRRSVWQSAWDEFKKTPLSGIGYGKKLSVEIGTNYRDFVEVRNIHNSLLTIFIQMGFLGIFLIAYVVYAIGRKVFQKLKSADIPSENRYLLTAFSLLLVNYLVAFLFQTYLETNLLGIFFWMILGGLSVVINEKQYADSRNK